MSTGLLAVAPPIYKYSLSRNIIIRTSANPLGSPHLTVRSPTTVADAQVKSVQIRVARPSLLIVSMKSMSIRACALSPHIISSPQNRLRSARQSNPLKPRSIAIHRELPIIHSLEKDNRSCRVSRRPNGRRVRRVGAGLASHAPMPRRAVISPTSTAALTMSTVKGASSSRLTSRSGYEADERFADVRESE